MGKQHRSIVRVITWFWGHGRYEPVPVCKTERGLERESQARYMCSDTLNDWEVRESRTHRAERVRRRRRKASWSSVSVWRNRRSRDLLLYAHALSVSLSLSFSLTLRQTLSLPLAPLLYLCSCALSERTYREGKNEEEVRRAARLVPTNAGLLMKRHAGHPITQVVQVPLYGN